MLAERATKLQIRQYIYIYINLLIFTSVCANFALSTFCASAQTLNLGTANCCAAFSFSFASLSINIIEIFLVRDLSQSPF